MDLRPTFALPANYANSSPLTPVENILDKFRDLVSTSQTLLCVHSLDGRLLSLNSAAASLLGYSQNEMLQRPMQDFLSAQDRPLFDLYLKEIKQKGESHGLLRLLTSSGKSLVWEYHNTLNKRSGGDAVVNGIALDVTTRVRAEQTLLEMNDNLMRIASEQAVALQKLSLSRALLDQANDAVMVIDAENFRLLDVNEKAWAVLGYTREELLLMTLFDIDPDLTQAEGVGVIQSLRDVGPSLLERRHRRKDGSTFPVEVNLRHVRLDREYTIAVARDITSRKLSEERLREFGRVVEHLEEMIVVVNREYKFVLVNRAYLNYRQLVAENVIGRSVSEVLGHELFTRVVKRQLDDCFAGQVVTYEGRYIYPKIGERDLSISYLPVEGPAGVERVAYVLRDITEQKRSEEALKASEARERARANELATVLDAVPIPVYISHDSQCKTITGNRAAYEQLRMAPGENFSKSTSLVSNFRLFEGGVELTPDKLPMQQAALTGKPVYESAQTMLFSDGMLRETLVYAVPLFDDHGNPRGAVGASVDLTDLKDAERALRESEHRFRAVYERSPIGIALIDMLSGKFMQANGKFCEITGRTEEELLHLDVGSVIYPDDQGEARQFLKDSSQDNFSNRELDKR